MARKTPQQNVANTDKLVPRPGHIVVRMYRQGLGDSFLLAVNEGTDGADVRYILIDCGVHSRQKEGPARLMQVLQNIRVASADALDIVVATHEHADHLSGFIQKGSPFLDGSIRVRQVWFAWTEKVGDKQADRLRSKHGVAKSILKRAVERASSGGANKMAMQLSASNDFETMPGSEALELDIVKAMKKMAGPRWKDLDSRMKNIEVGKKELPTVNGELGISAKEKLKPSSCELAIGLLHAISEEKPEYGEPGQTLFVNSLKSIRAYVLGPPRDEVLLRKDSPSKIPDKFKENGAGDFKEVYLSAVNSAVMASAPALGLSHSSDVAILGDDLQFPFGKASGTSLSGDERRKSSSSDNDSTETFRALYAEKGNSWRRIDADWIGGLENLGLQLDSDTNNTSLALAFELGPKAGDGRVLLFPGDAQVGNWLSWKRQEYGNKKTNLTAEDLLARTALYKVSHHASHNGTVRRDSTECTDDDPLGVPFGLPLMEDLIAMIPVSRDAAQNNGAQPWDMPYAPLYRELRSRTKRRVLRSDSTLAPLNSHNEEADLTPKSTGWTPVPGMVNYHWRRAKEKFKSDPKEAIYFDVEIPIND